MNKLHFPALPLAILCLAVPALPASADHGGVGFGREVTFDEQAQNAIAAWDGEEEVLILGTDVSSASPGKLLEFLPLPSRPKSMTEGDYDCFWTISSYFERRANNDWNSNGMGLDDPYRYYSPGIQILDRVNVGPHDITVVKISGTEHFNAWVRDFAADRGLPDPNIPERLGACVESYVGRNICYFVFDVIDVGPWSSRINPVVYTFDTPYLFYPLEVTRDTLSNGWWGHSISVFLVTVEKLRTSEDGRLYIGNLEGRALAERTSSDRLHSISLEIGRLFPEGAYLSHVALTLDSLFDLNRLQDVVLTCFDYENPMGYLVDQQWDKAGLYLSGVFGPLRGPSVYTTVPYVAPEDLAGQLAVLACIMIFISLLLGHLLFKLFRHLGPGLKWKRLLAETYALAYAMAVFGLFLPYPVLKICLALLAVIGVWSLVVAPVRKRIRARRFERELKALLKAPI